MLALHSLREVRMSRWAAVALGGLLSAAAMAAADTLVLREGRRVEGELVAVDGDTIEFRESGFFGGGRTRRYERAEVRRIELDEGSRVSRSERENRDDARAGEGGRPRGLREREVNVPAGTQWTDAGIDVRAGQTLYFEASGQIRWGKDRRDGPAGEGNSPYNAGRPIPRRPGAALIGKVGDGSGDFFFIGDDTGPIRMRSSGRLHLGINDDYLLDNSGAFRVTVYY